MSTSFGQAFIWLTISEILFNLSGYVVHSAVGRILGPEGYGRYGLVITATTMVVILVGNGVPTAMSKYLSEVFEKNPEKIPGIKREAMRLQLWLMGGLSVLFFLLAPLLAHLLRDPTLTPLFRVSALIIPAFAAASFYFYYYTGLHFFRSQAIIKTVRSLARVAFIVGCAYYFGLIGAIVGYILAPLIVFLVALAMERPLLRKYFPKALEKNAALKHPFPAKKLFHYAWPLVLFLLFYELVLTLDLYMVKALLQNDHLTGIYNASLTAGRIPYYLFYALVIMLLPALSKTTAENNTKESKRIVEHALRLMAIILLPMVALLTIYARPALIFLFGEDYAEGAKAMRALVPGVGFLTIFYVLSFALSGADKVRIPLRLAVAGVIGSVLLNLLLIPHFEIVGAALAVTIVSLLLALAILMKTHELFGATVSPATLGKSLVSLAVVLFLARYLPSASPWFIASGTILFALHLGILKFLGELTEADIKPFLKFFQKRKRRA